MKMKFFPWLPALAALVLCGCNTVTSKTIVGGEPAVLDPKIWNAKWQNADGMAMSTRVKDAKLGIIELKSFRPWTKPEPGEQQTVDIHLRLLGNEVIANEQQGAGGDYGFQRVVASANYIVTFDPNEKVFARLIKRGEITGKVERDKNGKPTGSCIIKGFSGRDYQRLKSEGFDVRSLFNEDPAQVFVRGHGLW
jgi:hypothetical protein